MVNLFILRGTMGHKHKQPRPFRSGETVLTVPIAGKITQSQKGEA